GPRRPGQEEANARRVQGVEEVGIAEGRGGARSGERDRHRPESESEAVVAAAASAVVRVVEGAGSVVDDEPRAPEEAGPDEDVEGDGRRGGDGAAVVPLHYLSDSVCVSPCENCDLAGDPSKLGSFCQRRSSGRRQAAPGRRPAKRQQIGPPPESQRQVEGNIAAENAAREVEAPGWVRTTAGRLILLLIFAWIPPAAAFRSLPKPSKTVQNKNLLPSVRRAFGGRKGMLTCAVGAPWSPGRRRTHLPGWERSIAGIDFLSGSPPRKSREGSAPCVLTAVGPVETRECPPHPAHTPAYYGHRASTLRPATCDDRERCPAGG
ncbi:hypothetical protein THAOC_11800, partial [Thalassiosira oceanica]